MIKNWIIGFWLGLLFLVVTAIFWYNQWQFALPTPVPSGYKAVSLGTKIDLGGKIGPSRSKPLLLHFFNPDCPCSKFNVKHFKSLVQQYRTQVDFAVVLETKQPYTVQDIRKRFALDIPIIRDSLLSVRCGVYSTPQAAIITSGNELFYRGNYNKTRYCTDKRTNYVQIALDKLLSNEIETTFEQLALKAYGCKLPACTN